MASTELLQYYGVSKNPLSFCTKIWYLRRDPIMLVIGCLTLRVVETEETEMGPACVFVVFWDGWLQCIGVKKCLRGDQKSAFILPCSMPTALDAICAKRTFLPRPATWQIHKQKPYIINLRAESCSAFDCKKKNGAQRYSSQHSSTPQRYRASLKINHGTMTTGFLALNV